MCLSPFSSEASFGAILAAVEGLRRLDFVDDDVAITCADPDMAIIRKQSCDATAVESSIIILCDSKQLVLTARTYLHIVHADENMADMHNEFISDDKQKSKTMYMKDNFGGQEREWRKGSLETNWQFV